VRQVAHAFRMRFREDEVSLPAPLCLLVRSGEAERWPHETPQAWLAASCPLPTPHPPASPEHHRCQPLPPLLPLHSHSTPTKTNNNHRAATPRNHPRQQTTRHQVSVANGAFPALATRPLSPVRRRPVTLNHVSCEPTTPQYKGIRSIANEQAFGNCASGSLSTRKTAAPPTLSGRPGNTLRGLTTSTPIHDRSAHIRCDGGNEEL
jgi:hypothetical protein